METNYVLPKLSNYKTIKLIEMKKTIFFLILFMNLVPFKGILNSSEIFGQATNGYVTYAVYDGTSNDANIIGYLAPYGQMSEGYHFVTEGNSVRLYAEDGSRRTATFEVWGNSPNKVNISKTPPSFPTKEKDEDTGGSENGGDPGDVPPPYDPGGGGGAPDMGDGSSTPCSLSIGGSTSPQTTTPPDGKVTVTINNSGTYQYELTNSDFSVDIANSDGKFTGLAADTYTVNVDGELCSGSKEFTVPFTDPCGDKINGKPVFSNLSSSQLKSEMLARIANPEFIDQNGTGLCGMACLAKYLAEHYPGVYQSLICKLYDNGKAKNPNTSYTISSFNTIGSNTLSQVVPSSNNYPTINGVSMAQADFLLLSCMKNTQNDWLNYDPTSWNNQTAGMTFPIDMKEMTTDFLGMSGVENNTNLFFSAGDYTALNGMESYRNNGGTVFMFISSNLLQNISSSPLGANHWVEYHGKLNIDIPNQKVSFEVYSWGGYRTVSVSFSTFKNNYYGYVRGMP